MFTPRDCTHSLNLNNKFIKIIYISIGVNLRNLRISAIYKFQ
jgi:hypothetical protein